MQYRLLPRALAGVDFHVVGIEPQIAVLDGVVALAVIQHLDLRLQKRLALPQAAQPRTAAALHDDAHHGVRRAQDLNDARDGADLVLGSRYIGGIRIMNWPMHRLLLSTGAGHYVRIVTGMPITDPTGGFKCFRRAVLEAIDLDRITSNGYSFQIEMTHSAWMKGFKVQEIPIVFEDRRAGYSKMRANIATEAMLMVLRLWARCGFRRSPRKPRD